MVKTLAKLVIVEQSINTLPIWWLTQPRVIQPMITKNK
jgi:hypothetical protein